MTSPYLLRVKPRLTHAALDALSARLLRERMTSELSPSFHVGRLLETARLTFDDGVPAPSERVELPPLTDWPPDIVDLDREDRRFEAAVILVLVLAAIGCWQVGSWAWMGLKAWGAV